MRDANTDERHNEIMAAYDRVRFFKNGRRRFFRDTVSAYGATARILPNLTYLEFSEALQRRSREARQAYERDHA